MALIALASSKGSPGVTTAALALGALWPRPVVVAECDTAGSDIPIRMPAVDGGVLDGDRGLVTLAAAGRRGLRSDLVLSHTQQAVGGLDVLVGLRVPEQAAGIGNMWPQLGSIFDGLQGYDVIADLGRCGAQTPQNALMRSARLVVMVCNTDPASIVHLRERAAVLAKELDPTNPHGVPLGVMVVGEPRRKREAIREVFEAVQQMEVSIAHQWQLAWDPTGAAIFSGAVSGRPDRTTLIRSAREVAGNMARVVEPFFISAEIPEAAMWEPEADEGGWHMQVEPQPWQQPHIQEAAQQPPQPPQPAPPQYPPSQQPPYPPSHAHPQEPGPPPAGQPPAQQPSYPHAPPSDPPHHAKHAAEWPPYDPGTGQGVKHE